MGYSPRRCWPTLPSNGGVHRARDDDAIKQRHRIFMPDTQHALSEIAGATLLSQQTASCR